MDQGSLIRRSPSGLGHHSKCGVAIAFGQVYAGKCENASDYITKHEALRSDLSRAGYTKTDTQLVIDLVVRLITR